MFVRLRCFSVRAILVVFLGLFYYFAWVSKSFFGVILGVFRVSLFVNKFCSLGFQKSPLGGLENLGCFLEA